MPVADRPHPAQPISEPEASELFTPLAGHSAIAVAVSGGADSMACLRLVHRWAGADGKHPHLTCLTVDHRLRPQSTADAGQVARWCADIGVPCEVLIWHGPHPQTNIQECARQVRYDLMTDWCRAHATEILVVAHHLEDQAETLLMRLARGSAIGGLGAMAKTTRRDGVALFRPFLDTSRARLAASLKQFGQAWLEDPSNTNHDFERVRVRAALPGLADIGLTAPALARTARRAARAARALDDIAGKILDAARQDGVASLAKSAFDAAPEEIQLRLLAGLITRAGGARLPHGRQLERAVATMRAPDFSAFTLGGCKVGLRKGQVYVTREGRRSIPEILAIDS